MFLSRSHSPPPSPISSSPPATISASELSLADGRERPLRRLDPGMMPLPDTAAGLEWSSLVNAAKAYEGRHFPPNLARSLPPALSKKAQRKNLGLRSGTDSGSRIRGVRVHILPCLLLALQSRASVLVC